MLNNGGDVSLIGNRASPSRNVLHESWYGSFQENITCLNVLFNV